MKLLKTETATSVTDLVQYCTTSTCVMLLYRKPAFSPLAKLPYKGSSTLCSGSDCIVAQCEICVHGSLSSIKALQLVTIGVCEHRYNTTWLLVLTASPLCYCTILLTKQYYNNR
jgi:hypothetical protein